MSHTEQRRQPSIYDVAKRAGVSIKTVSRVINGADNVSPPTEKRVRQAIEKLSYAPSSSARQFARSRGRRTFRVGVVIPVEPAGFLAHRYFFEALQGFGEALHGDGHQLMVHVHARSESFVDLWRSGSTDGMIVMSAPAGDRRVVELQEESVPFVLTCRPDEPGSDLDRSVSWVDADHATGGQAAVNHLLSLGHRRLAVVNGPRDLMISRLRDAGVTAALEAHGLSADAVTRVNADFTVEDGQAIGALLLSEMERPTAIVCGDDTLALGVINAAERAHIPVPDGLSVVGYDDIEISSVLKPPLTTVRQGARLKGRLAAATLLRRIDRVSAGEASEQHLLPTELIVRSSSAPPPMGS